jgi:Protein of unknown function (DUF2628)
MSRRRISLDRGQERADLGFIVSAPRFDAAITVERSRSNTGTRGFERQAQMERFGFKPNALFQRADQESIREDLREFFGPRAEKYLAIYDKMRAANKSHAVSWNWAAFFATYTWFFYRKMYLFGVCLIVIQFAVSFVFGIYGMVAYAAALTVGGKSQYVLWAMKKLDEADARGLVGKERQDYLRRMGGVSVVAGIGREHW